jgi:DNA topoisomerase VI subunit A
MANKKASPPEDRTLKFVRLRGFDEDIIGYVTETSNSTINVDMPLRVMVETIFDEGRQVLSMQEYLPQSIVDKRSVDLNMADVYFMATVKADFFEQYEYVRDFFYNNEPVVNAKKKERVDGAAKEKVVSIFDALASKKDKPVH